MRLPRRVGAGHAADLRKLLIDAPQFIPESLKLAGLGRQRYGRRILGRRGRPSLRGRVSSGFAGRAGLVLDSLSIGREALSPRLNVFQITRKAS